MCVGINLFKCSMLAIMYYGTCDVRTTKVSRDIGQLWALSLAGNGVVSVTLLKCCD